LFSLISLPNTHTHTYISFILLACASEHEYKLLSPSRVNVFGLSGNWFWRVGSVAYRFYCLEANPKDSLL
jgi:hypothetical protein